MLNLLILGRSRNKLGNKFKIEVIKFMIKLIVKLPKRLGKNMLKVRVKTFLGMMIALIKMIFQSSRSIGPENRLDSAQLKKLMMKRKRNLKSLMHLLLPKFIMNFLELDNRRPKKLDSQRRSLHIFQQENLIQKKPLIQNQRTWTKRKTTNLSTSKTKIHFG